MDSSKDTLLHIKRVNCLCGEAAIEIIRRGNTHDSSKLTSPEKEYFDESTDKLAKLHYDSPEYKKSLADIKPAIDHHYANNSHHPQHYANGINDMDLFDVIEMLIDWKASGERQLDGNILVSLEKNKERFGIDNQLYKILKNTVERYYR